MAFHCGHAGQMRVSFVSADRKVKDARARLPLNVGPAEWRPGISGWGLRGGGRD